LAVFPFGKKIKVISTPRNSDTRFEAIIPSEKYVNPKGPVDVGDIAIPGVETKAEANIDEHGVTIEISPISELVHRYFRDRPSKRTTRNTYGAENTPMGRFQWAMQEDLPLEYEPGSSYAKAFSDLPAIDFSVRLNGKKLLRNSPGSDVLESDTWVFGGIRCRYVITTDWQSLRPDARGLKIRLHNVGIGQRETFGLGVETRAYSRLHWLSGEIRILKGFDQLLNIDRAKFQDSPEYEEFRSFFRTRLSRQANSVEDIAESKRDIERQLTDSRLAIVGRKEDLIRKDVKRLEDKGFKVKVSKTSTKGKKPISVDLKARTVEIIDDGTEISDYVSIRGEKIPVSYSSWNFQKDPRAVRRGVDGEIEINQVYPLFMSKRYGEVFKRVFVILLLSDESVSKRSELQSHIAEQFLSEFIDIL